MANCRRLMALLLLFSISCSYGTYFIPKQNKTYASTTPEKIAISTQKKLALNYEKIARVAVFVWGGADKARRALQKEASILGANAIIQVTIDRKFWRTSAEGLAIRIFSKN